MSTSSSNRESVIAATLLGFATGILSWTGFATVVATRSPEALPGWARSRWVKRVALPAAAGEIVANAVVASLPPRTFPPALLGRVVMGAATGGLAGYSAGSTRAGAVSGALASPVGAWLATNSRSRLAKSIPDIVVALGETAVAAGLSQAGARRGTGKP